MEPISTPQAIPQAPRAMLQQGAKRPTLASLEQIFQNASQEFYPRLVLFKELVGFKDMNKRRDRSTDKLLEGRREFLCSFSYLCDVEKGGATVTAAGLQALPKSNILWLAANEGIRVDVESYANKILSKLRGVGFRDPKAIADDIFQLAVDNCQSRITYYKGELHKYAVRCRMELRRGRNSDETGRR
jgi:hypothetical protein